jgi:hypothetical protein
LYLRMPPGQEVQPMAGFLATLLLWLASGAVLLAVGVSVAVARRKASAAGRTAFD